MTPEPLGTDGVVRALRRDGDDLVAAVMLQASEACPRCAEGRGCGANLFGRRSPATLVDVRLPADCAARPGDTVRVALADGHLLQAALLAYGAPLAGALLGSLAAWTAGAGDGVSVLAALLGLAGGAGLARRRLHRAGRTGICSLRVTP